jgi:hypothetical protein
MAAWGELATFREGRRNFTITDNGLAGSGANRDGKSDNRHVIDGKEDDKERARRRREVRAIR